MIKVLLVDDDTDLLDMVCLMLKVPGIEPVCIEDCNTVLPTLDEAVPHVLVMDIFLGDCDGRKLCKQVKSMEKFSSLPILLYSAGQISNASIEECGADGFLPKPFEMDMLLSRIQGLVNKANSN